ncbi:MAG: hypothetical protein ACRCT2_13685 [Plesiomonas shigelloides]
MEIEVKPAMDLFPRRELGGHSGPSEEVEREFCVGNRFVPQVHRKVFICRGPAGGQMVLRCPDGAFSGIAAVVVWWGELILDAIVGEEIFELLGAFIVQSVESWLKPTAGKDLVDVLDRFEEMLGLA